MFFFAKKWLIRGFNEAQAESSAADYAFGKQRFPKAHGHRKICDRMKPADFPQASAIGGGLPVPEIQIKQRTKKSKARCLGLFSLYDDYLSNIGLATYEV